MRKSNSWSQRIERLGMTGECKRSGSSLTFSWFCGLGLGLELGGCGVARTHTIEGEGEKEKERERERRGARECVRMRVVTSFLWRGKSKSYIMRYSYPGWYLIHTVQDSTGQT